MTSASDNEMTSRLLVFLSSTRSFALSSTPKKPFTLVLGNASADLDSAFSAITYAYCKSNAKESNLHIPLINLSNVPSSDLWRLRAEYGTALRQAVNYNNGDDEQNKALLADHLTTIADIIDNPNSRFHTLFTGRSSENAKNDADSQIPLVLVDHNSPTVSGRGVDEATFKQYTILAGCIDHHLDEKAVPDSASPRTIEADPAPGSCTSLVVSYLRAEGLLKTEPETNEDEHEDDDDAEIAKLALAPILIDTSNLSSKVQDVDAESVAFLEQLISAKGARDTITADAVRSSQWNRKSFFASIAARKTNSLNLLTTKEILDRDYKAWTETRAIEDNNDNNTTGEKSHQVTVGFSTVVRPLSWLLREQQAGEFVRDIEAFAREQEPRLDLHVLMTAFTDDSKDGDGEGEFRRELMIVGCSEEGNGVVDGVAREGVNEFRLGAWEEHGELVKILQDNKKGRVYWQRDLSKSRKQVAPFVRKVMRES